MNDKWWKNISKKKVCRICGKDIPFLSGRSVFCGRDECRRANLRELSRLYKEKKLDMDK